jgi:hypothetical protein
MVVNPSKRRGVVRFNGNGEKVINFGGRNIKANTVAGRLECLSKWCRFWNYTFGDHHDYLALKSGEIVEEYCGGHF